MKKMYLKKKSDLESFYAKPTIYPTFKFTHILTIVDLSYDLYLPDNNRKKSPIHNI